MVESWYFNSDNHSSFVAEKREKDAAIRLIAVYYCSSFWNIVLVSVSTAHVNLSWCVQLF